MNPGLLGGLVAVGVVGLVAMLLRGSRTPGSSGVSDGGARPAESWREDGNVAVAGEDERDRRDDGDPDGDDDGHVIAVTSDGAAFVPDRHAVRLVPPEEQGEEWKVGAGIKSSNLRGEQALAMSWHAAEFTGARVVRGGADEGPWRLEALGRDGEYISFAFETREGADAARLLFERLGVVRLGQDDDGRPMPPSAEQFAEARRVYQETEAALDMPDGEDAP